ncbi:hypothetical protein ACWESM_22065 [Nocardia sp. NPDC003999]
MCMHVRFGDRDPIVAGGLESVSRSEFYATDIRWGIRGEGAALHDHLARDRITVGGKNSAATAAIPSATMGIGTIPATEKALACSDSPERGLLRRPRAARPPCRVRRAARRPLRAGSARRRRW